MAKSKKQSATAKKVANKKTISSVKKTGNQKSLKATGKTKASKALKAKAVKSKDTKNKTASNKAVSSKSAKSKMTQGSAKPKKTAQKKETVMSKSVSKSPKKLKKTAASGSSKTTQAKSVKSHETKKSEMKVVVSSAKGKIPSNVNKIKNSLLTPLDDRLIVKVAQTEKTTASGLLVIPDTVTDVSGNLKAQVLAAGRGHQEKNGKIRPMDVQAGDHVVFSAYAGTKIQIEGEEFLILRESDIMGVVR